MILSLSCAINWTEDFQLLKNSGKIIFMKINIFVVIRPPKDMDQTFHTLIHAGAKSEIEELAAVRH